MTADLYDTTNGATSRGRLLQLVEAHAPTLLPALRLGEQVRLTILLDRGGESDPGGRYAGTLVLHLADRTRLRLCHVDDALFAARGAARLGWPWRYQEPWTLPQPWRSASNGWTGLHPAT